MTDRFAVAHDRVKDLDWEPDYFRAEPRYPTRYKLPKKTKDPFKHLIRQYCAMENEKDDRQYGSLTDLCTRTGAISNAEPRWAEVQKIVLPTLTLAEYGAAKCQGLLIDAVENAELRQGYLAQMMDEVRHYNQQMWLIRYWSKHWSDPEGFAYALKHKGQNLFYRPGRSFFETFMNSDPISSSVSLQVMGETAYTNPLFVAMTEIAAANGDNATPTVFLSIQSDESRHMANGYATLAAVLSEPDNIPLLQQDLNDMFWRGSRFLDPFMGAVYDYFQKVRLKSYAEYWDEWIWEDWGGAYMARLEPFGITPPVTLEYSKNLARTGQHAAAILAYAAWPLNYWRFDPPTEADFEWFEEKYPGYYDLYGNFWDLYKALADPSEGATPLGVMASVQRLPAFCRVCQMPGILPELFAPTERIVQKGDQWEAFCSAECEALFDREPHRYLAYTPFFTRYDGWDLADIILDWGLVRADGKTLLGQPVLESDRPWTVDDIRRCGVEIQDPVRLYVEELRGQK